VSLSVVESIAFGSAVGGGVDEFVELEGCVLLGFDVGGGGVGSAETIERGNKKHTRK
jgi:hypothetical protein